MNTFKKVLKSVLRIAVLAILFSAIILIATARGFYRGLRNGIDEALHTSTESLLSGIAILQ